MKKTINHLVQLQELTIARAQQATLKPGVRLTELDQAIETMFKQLPPDVAGRFKKLEARGPLCIVPLAHGVCTACGMSLPVSFVQTVHKADTLNQCPNCATLLYYPTFSPRAKPRKTRRGEPPKVGIERFSAPSLMVPALEAHSGEEAIRELCATLAENEFIEHTQELIDAALAREAIMSTAVDHGLAFPHVRGVEGGGLTMAVGRSKKGFHFDDSSKRLTRLVFFVVIPVAASAFYLKLLSGLTQTFREAESREKLLAAETPAEMWKALVRLTRTTVS